MANQPKRKPVERGPAPLISPYSNNIPVTRAASAKITNLSARPSLSSSSTKGSSLPYTSERSLTQAHSQSAIEAALKTCECCEVPRQRIWNCSYCDMSFCDECWDRQGPHKPGRTGPDGLPHEKGDPNVVKRLKAILTPPADPTEQQVLHLEDEDTTWFGIARDDANQPVFQDYGRYTTIMADSSTGTHDLRYPQLVSFIGQTGAGKSTLVKMLIDQQERKLAPPYDSGNFPSPVVGSVRNENVPTSGDVHLYGDPQTYLGEHPLLYADCEGLEGGEIMPISAQLKEKQAHPTHIDHGRRQTKHKVARGTPRNIKWADSPEKSKRQYAVTELYPRLLYTFSDAIVFVLRNPKTFESTVLSKLIDWASASMEKSLNQPTLPHAVIALNATDLEVDQDQWDPDHATTVLMSTVAGAVHSDPNYRALADYWIGRGKQIRTMADLLECYYSSITVVRIPIKGRYMKIDEQIAKLHTVLVRRCAESFRAKRRSRMLSNSEELNTYLQCAFDHFSQDLDAPFDFMDVAFRINPIPSDFGGNILKLAMAIKKSSRFSDPRKMFRELSLMVASCILLDCVRQGLKGPAEQILEKVYMDYCDTALDDFCAIFWPCAFTNRRGRCVNVRDGHKKGHQNAKGQIIGMGDYVSTFTWESFADEWSQLLQQYLSDFQRDVQQQIANTPATTELDATTSLHRTNANLFYKRLGSATMFISHSTCFCCLREIAEHPLPCGHVLCSPCVMGYGKPQEGASGIYSIVACPLHSSDSTFATPHEVCFKPPLAGVRVLSLDGGGIRGIVILVVLLSIEKELGNRIPVQDFFDLIVGTSTGGIVALALGIKNWPVKTCIALFRKLVDSAFTPKLYGGLMLGKRKYRTRPLEEVLRESFKEEAIFGGSHESSASYARKVAVTASSETGEQAVIFTNYNRADDDQANYRHERPDDPTNGLRLWEAARATSAAPTFFRPFVNSRTKEGFIDGAVFHNNPVRIANYESKLLWPDVEDHHPDILLSIGTGHNGADTEGFVDSTQTGRRHERMVLKKRLPDPPKSRGNIAALWAFPEVNSWINVLFKRVDNLLNSEAIWQSFRSDVVGSSGSSQVSRYIRFNPRIGFPTPKMDDKSMIDELYADVDACLETPNMRDKIVRIAHRLVASCFYFEKSGPAREVNDQYVVQGTIRCRFRKGSNNLRNLGAYLRRHQMHDFQPFFRIQETQHPEKRQHIYISREVISMMTETGCFEIGTIVLPMSHETDVVSVELYLTNDKRPGHPFTGYPISGCPRNLAEGDAPKRAEPLILESNRTRMAMRRESLRRKRGGHPRLSDERPSSTVSDATSNSNSNSFEFPEDANDVGNWVRRRREARRAPSKPVQRMPDTPSALELDASSPLRLTEDEDEDQVALAQALERSQQEAIKKLARMGTGTDEDEDELQKVMLLSLLDK